MSRDGLLPKKFSKIHPKFKTPSFATIMTGLLVGLPALVLDSDFVTDLTSIGTLFAFVLVCGGILVIPKQIKQKGRFKIPYINGKFIIPLIFILTIALIQYIRPDFFANFFSLHNNSAPDMSAFDVIRERLPYYIFSILFLLITVYSYLRNYSLIPVLGLLSCFYLMTELGVRNWERFVIWLVIGLVIYFGYSYKKSKLNKVD